MAATINLKNKKFGKLIVVKKSKVQHGRGAIWTCVCECGNIRDVLAKNLISKSTCSCRDCAKKRFKHNKTTHGMRYERTYAIWASMKARCSNRKNVAYPDYGGRGIKVCKRWMKFENFYKDMGKVPKEKSIDRKNNNGNYCKKNCRWATTTEQIRNRSISLRIDPPVEKAKKLGISYSAAYMRRKRERYDYTAF